MTIAAPLASPFFTGAGINGDVPGVWDCSLNGRGYMFDWKYADRLQRASFQRNSIPLLKPQMDNSGNLSEASLNPDEAGRRAAESWHHGSGQTYLDAADFDPFRFHASKGVDVWTKKQATLLHDTSSRRASANTNLMLAVAGTRVYLTDGTALLYSTDAAAWTAVTGLPGVAPIGIASDGFTVYTTHGASGIYSTNTGTGASASYNPRAATGICDYVKGRLIISNGDTLVNITGAGTETILLTAPNTAFRWVGAAAGPTAIYAAGFAGDKSLIYRTAVKADGTALDIAVVAGELPDGEIVRSINGYLGFIQLGTDKGVRFCEPASNGDLTIGALIPTPAAVFCFEGQDRFCWYGLTNFDAVSTGLGRLDLSETAVGGALTPAYASDLMATTQGAVQSVVTFLGLRLFTVSGQGVYGELTSLVGSGYVDSGQVTFGLPDAKIALYLDVRHDALAGSVTAQISADGGLLSTLGSSAAAGSAGQVFTVGNLRGQRHEIRLTLARSSTVNTSGPSVRRWTLEANPAPGRGETWEVPLLVFDTVTCANGSERTMNVAAEYEALLSAEDVGAPITYTDGSGSQTVFLDDHLFIPEKYSAKRDGFQGTFVANLRRPRKRN